MWETVFKGGLFIIEKHSVKWYERAVRPPGVRLILRDTEWKILITKEFRKEKNAFDFRLPWWKVFDDIDSFLSVRDNPEKLKQSVERACLLEAKQEAWIDGISNFKIIKKSVAGASIEWDLYYCRWIIDSISNQALDGDELYHGIEVHFFTDEEIIQMIQDWEITEDRTIGILSQIISMQVF
jgi:hypothetical protein